MTDKVPNYIYKLAITEDVISKSIVKLLEDFNIFLDEDKALKLFYSILAHFMYRLDTNPGNYFKLKFIDIVADNDNMLAVRRSSDYTEDTVTPRMFYERFCGTQMLKEELANNVDLFAKAMLGVVEEKQKEKQTVDRLLNKKKKLVKEIDKYKEQSSSSKKVKAKVLKQRKDDERRLKAEYRQAEKKTFITQMELKHRERFIKERKQLEQQLRTLWETDKDSFQF